MTAVTHNASDFIDTTDDADVFLDGGTMYRVYPAEEIEMIVSSWRQARLGKASVEQFDALLRDNFPEFYGNNGEG